ncbi:MAG TPA: outer membrane protein transport protein, partial [Thermomicrobiales bacterium]|nr:outer membrane protein transport protein [Thermomicrobiales bacterium]
MRGIRLSALLLAAGTAAALPLAARAGGFQLNEDSAKSMARANAGAASANTDASAIFYNPALLTQLTNMQFIAGFTNFRTRGEFSKTSATDLAGQPLSGGNGGDMGDHNSLGAGVAPALFFAAPLANRTVFGIGLEAPFGLTTTFDG